ncbi:hypothetical protein VTK73DRAFT_3464 [Phialemonium thermophilum]|uniref:Uncharacterized protein n=1 Tax=Phialemonium thermophilum TaxID=223376 RepID=A0ABR3VI22_9PEZI
MKARRCSWPEAGKVPVQMRIMFKGEDSIGQRGSTCALFPERIEQTIWPTCVVEPANARALAIRAGPYRGDGFPSRNGYHGFPGPRPAAGAAGFISRDGKRRDSRMCVLLESRGLESNNGSLYAIQMRKMQQADVPRVPSL